MNGCHVQPEQMFNLIFGYNDRHAEDLGGAKSGDGGWDVSSSAIASDEIWVVQFVYLRNQSGARGNVLLRFHDGTDYYIGGAATTPARNVPTVWNGAVPLKAGDTVNVFQGLCLDGDNIQAGAWGYKMKLTQ